MTYTRKNVWSLGGGFDDPTLLWYARGVKAMKERALNVPTAWQFYGAIHGIDQGLWQQLGYLKPSDPMPSSAVMATYWNQCQHGSWYFLPWHRGYLIAFESVIRDAISTLPGAPKDWALPYWNYFKAGQDRLPPAFGSAKWPDGESDNPLYVPQRYGPKNNGNVYVPVNQINLNALGDPDFTGDSGGGSPGFGGVDTGFSHGGEVHGGIETQPHDWVHGLVGGGDPHSNLPGLMSDPDTAALDPIFWLHHANIDRLWEVWRENPTTDVDPSDPNWVNGPAAVGGQAFILPLPGGASWTYTPGEMTDYSKLSYVYDDVSPPSGAPRPVARLQRLGMSLGGAKTLVRNLPVPESKTVELLGANNQSLRLTGTGANTSVTLEPSIQRKVSANLLSVATAEPSVPDRIFLNLENVRGVNDATAFNVYVNVPEGADPAQHPENLAGSIALFGVRKATSKDGEHAGNGLTYVLEITHVIDALHLAGTLNANALQVRLVAVNPVPEASQITIGGIKVFRQSA